MAYRLFDAYTVAMRGSETPRLQAEALIRTHGWQAGAFLADQIAAAMLDRDEQRMLDLSIVAYELEKMLSVQGQRPN